MKHSDRPQQKVRLSYDPRRTSRPRRAPNITGSIHPLLFEAGCGAAIATAGRTSDQCYYRVPRFRARQDDFQAGGVSGVGMGERHRSMLARRATIRARQHSASNASNMSRAGGGQYWDLA